MTLIIGGSFQGKTEFAKEHYALTEILDGEVCPIDEVYTAVAVRHFERLIKRVIPQDSPTDFARRLCRENPGLMVISDEIGGGIIPIESDSRLWREEVGKSLCILAEFSDTVIRINCGLPTVIKGAI